jgi:hypothetical protein
LSYACSWPAKRQKNCNYFALILLFTHPLSQAIHGVFTPPHYNALNETQLPLPGSAIRFDFDFEIEIDFDLDFDLDLDFGGMAMFWLLISRKE